VRTSHASVRTDRADRYVKQLLSHLGRKAGVTLTGDGHRLSLSAGSCVVRSVEGRIELTAEADTDQALHAVEEVVARHLIRFGQRDELLVTWVTDSSS
jgi:uncharacterized protein